MSTREVLLEGASPWGFRMTGGADVALSLRISRVNPGSKAAAKGVREGDLITSINKQATKNLTNSESHALLRTVKENLLLGLNQDPDASPKRKSHKERHQTPVESLPPQLPAPDSTNNKGDKKASTKARRERKKKLKTRLREIFGLNKKNEGRDGAEQTERSTEGSERSLATRNEDINSEGASTRVSDDNASLYYDNDSTNETGEINNCEISDQRIVSESQNGINIYRINNGNKSKSKDCFDSNTKQNVNYSDVFVSCSDYLMDCKESENGIQEPDSVPPDIVLSSNKAGKTLTETVVIKEVIEHHTVRSNVPDKEDNRNIETEKGLVSVIKKSNDLNNNKSGDKKREAVCSNDRISAKRVHIFHSSDEYKIDEMEPLDNVDKKQSTGESVQCIPERSVNLCKAIVSFEDGGSRSAEHANNSDRPFIVLEDDASLILNPRDGSSGINALDSIDGKKVDGNTHPMYYAPGGRYLDVIKEEPSDISSDSEKNKEYVSHGKYRTQQFTHIDEFHPGGIDTSWRDGKSLDDISDAPAASDSLSDTDLLFDDTKPPKCVSSSDLKKASPKGRILSSSKPKYLQNRSPSSKVIKSVVASYFTNKSTPVTIERTTSVNNKVSDPVEVCQVKSEKQTENNDVEIVFIESSDSDAMSLRSDNLLNGSLSNRSSLEQIEEEIRNELANENYNNIHDDNICVTNKSDERKRPPSPPIRRNNRPEEFKREKYAEEMIELSHSIITEIAENLSSGANSRVTSARSTPCNFFSPRSTPLKEILNKPADVKELSKNDNSLSPPNGDSSSNSSSSTAKLLRPIPPLEQLCTEVISDTPNSANIIKKLDLDQDINYDSGSDYFPETSDYSEPSRLSSTSTEGNSRARSHSDIAHPETDPERPLSSCASSIVFLSGPGKVSVEPWIGLPLADDPRFVVCFSPSQLSSSSITIDQQKASELFDLHKKFIRRRGYHENSEINHPELDLISIEKNGESEKEKMTQQVLTEAANLLALEQYRTDRTEKNKSSKKNIVDEEDNASGRDKKLNIGCSEDDRKGGTERITRHDEEVGSSRLLELIQKEEVKSSPSPESIMLVEKSTTSRDEPPAQPNFDSQHYSISKRGDIAIRKGSKSDEKIRPKSLPPSTEIFRKIMYEEYMDKVAERMERRQMKMIKVSDSPSSSETAADKGKRLEAEFMDKVRERMEKLGLKEDENEKESADESPDGNEPSDNLPKHLKELVEIFNEESGVWSPAGTPEAERKKFDFSQESSRKEEKKDEDDSGSVVWTPRSAGASPQLDRKKYRPINFQSPPPQRKQYHKKEDVELPKELPVAIVSSTSEGSTLSNQNSKLPPAQNPVITLLQKAREGQIPKGAQYLETREESRSERVSQSSVGQHEVFYSVKKEYESDSEDKKKKVVELTPRKFEGIGPTTKGGTPIALRSEVKEDNQQKWYKRMYDSLHKADNDNLLPYAGWSSGYLSEPDRLYYDSDASISSKYATLDRRRTKSTRDTSTVQSDYLSTNTTLPRSSRYSAGVRHAVDIYRNQPGRIEDYEPGHSSIADKEKQQWLDEVMDIFDGEFKSHSRNERSAIPVVSGASGKSFTSVLKEGYDSDSTLVFKRRERSDLSPEDHKMAYKIIQRGGDIPLHGLRKPAPNKPKESGREYIEGEVNIHYKTPVRVEQKEYIEEGELARRQAEALRRIYQQQRRNKYLAELNDIHSRRHQDYFTPSQKSPIPLNRYDDFPMEVAPPRPRDRTPEPKLVARALYNFLGQSSRELSFRRGDIIFVRRQIDKNWYEGEHNAMIGLFPINYVEIIPYDGIRTLPKKSTEGQARAKFNFQAQTHLELSLVKGELVLLTRRVDENWFEGRIGNKKGIFPVSYVQVLVEPGEVPYSVGKPVVAPASHSVMLNGAKDIGSQMQPPRPPSVGSPTMSKEQSQISQLFHIDSRSDPVPYRAMYNYKPQNDDELELREGDVVYVMEKCDDGWYVGSLHRNGQFGTFPGNYVQRIP